MRSEHLEHQVRSEYSCIKWDGNTPEHKWLMIAYIALFSALLSRLTAFACGSAWVTSFITRFFNIHRSSVLTALAWLGPHETAAVSAQVLCTPYNHAPCHFMQSHTRKVYACLAVTCHRGWNGYRNKNQHRKLTLEKQILPPFQQGFEPVTFQSRVRRSNHWDIPAPREIRTLKIQKRDSWQQKKQCSQRNFKWGWQWLPVQKSKGQTA